MVLPGTRWGKPVLIVGKLTSEPKFLEVRGGLLKGHVGSAIYPIDNKQVMLLIDKAGKTQTLQIAAGGSPGGEGPAVAISPASPVKEWTSLGMKDADTLLAGADGSVIEFARDASGWKESKRWSSWGSDGNESFGGKIHISCESKRLWVSDSLRHRVLCFDAATGKPLGAFGACDKAGDDLQSLSGPSVITARGNRAVVFDAGNQRLVKLLVR
jgi:hypothetical protein